MEKASASSGAPPKPTKPSEPGRKHEFHTRKGKMTVIEQELLMHGGEVPISRGKNHVGELFDLRRLRVGNEEGGFVTLRNLLAVEREAETWLKIDSNPHVLRCHGSLTQNVGRIHCRILLTSPSICDLAARLEAAGGSLDVDESIVIGQELSQGLQFLHHQGLLCGSITPHGVVKGADGLWKLGDLGSSSKAPVDVADWREACVSVLPKDEPPEVRLCKAEDGSDQSHPMTTAADLWMLGVLLLTVTFGMHPYEGAEDYAVAHSRWFVPPMQLTKSTCAKFCLLLHWLLDADPQQRLAAGEGAALLGTLKFMAPQEVLSEMPSSAQANARSMVDTAARQIALEDSPRKMLARLHVAPLTELVGVSGDARMVCECCGVDPASVPAPDVSSAKAVTDMASSDVSTDVGSSPDSISDADLLGKAVSKAAPTGDLLGNPFSEAPVGQTATNEMEDLLDFDSPKPPQRLPQDSAQAPTSTMDDLLDFGSASHPEARPDEKVQHTTNAASDLLDMDLIDFGSPQVRGTGPANGYPNPTGSSSIQQNTGGDLGDLLDF